MKMTKAETLEIYQKARDVNIIDVLASYGFYPNSEGYYSCPLHGEKTPSARILKIKGEIKNRLKCFGCGKTITSVDVVMEQEKCTSLEAVQKLLNTEFKTNREKGNEHQHVKQHSENNYTYKDGLNMSRPLSSENIGYIETYLKKRCILNTLDIAKSLGIEIRHSYYKDTNHICYYFKDYDLIVRKPVDGSRDANNWGEGRPVYLKANDSNVWYIVEGIEDALTLIIYHGFNVVCLNSTNNTGKFVEGIDENFDTNNVEFIIATDNDNAGISALKELDRNFKQKKIQYKLYHKFYDYAKKHDLKDINECFIYSHKK